MRMLYAALLAVVIAVSTVGAQPGVAQGPTLFDFDFRAVSLRAALTAVAKREGIVLAPMPTVPDGASLGVTFTQVRPEQVWAALMRPYNLAYVDDAGSGMRYVGTEQAISAEFPSSSVQQVAALSYPGDINQAGDITRTLADVVGPGTQFVVDRRRGTVVVIGSANAIAKAEAIFAALKKTSQFASGQYAIRTYPLQNLRVSEAAKTLTTALGTIQAPDTLAQSPENNALIATGTDDFLARVGDLVRSMDQPVPLMKLDVTVVALEPNNDNSNVGITFGGVSATGTATAGTYQTTITRGTAVQINATLSAMVQTGHAAVMSRGALYSRNNIESDVDSVTTYPFVELNGFTNTTVVQTFDVGATIKMTPTFLADGMLVSVDASYSTLQGFSANNGPPIIAKNHTKGDLLLHDDEGLVISGFYSDVSSDTLSKIPFLGDIPLVGGLFRSRQTSRTRAEIAFIVIPHKGSTQDVVAGPAPPIGTPAGLDLKIPVVSPSMYPGSETATQSLFAPHGTQTGPQPLVTLPPRATPAPVSVPSPSPSVTPGGQNP